MDPDISILQKTGHFYFALTRAVHCALIPYFDELNMWIPVVSKR